MHNGYSSIFRSFSANIFAAVICLVGAVFAFVCGFVGWIPVIPFVLACVIFLIEKNPFVRRAAFTVMLLSVTLIVSWLLFRLILPWTFFAVIHWIIVVAVTLLLVFCGLCAFNGKAPKLPLLCKLIDPLCK